MGKVVTFGEVMMRLSPPGHAKFSQANLLELTYGGGEANVAISLAYLGMKTAHVTRFPNNLIGYAAAQFLNQHWVDISHVLFGGDYIGKYFLEKGATHRSSRIIYERDNSSFANLQPEMLDWDDIFDGADWFHWTGITPAISETTARACEAAINAARRKNVRVSVDIHSRKSLWNYGKSVREVMPELVGKCDVVMGGHRDIQDVFGVEFQGTSREKFIDASQYLMKTSSIVQKVVDKKREMVNASHNRVKGKMWNGERYLSTQKLDITHIIDRVGTGDAFAAGIIYGLMNSDNDQEALEFGTAACALKHTIEGDANMINLEDVHDLMKGDKSGKIKR